MFLCYLESMPHICSYVSLNSKQYCGFMIVVFISSWIQTCIISETNLFEIFSRAFPKTRYRKDRNLYNSFMVAIERHSVTICKSLLFPLERKHHNRVNQINGKLFVFTISISCHQETLNLLLARLLEACYSFDAEFNY